nr:hypothetical protein [Ignavibacteria bacterium]
VNVRFPFGINFIFPYIRGAAFFDVGNAWDKVYSETKGSVGIGARINLFYILALRYDIGKRIEKNFTKFQDGIFQPMESLECNLRLFSAKSVCF